MCPIGVFVFALTPHSMQNIGFIILVSSHDHLLSNHLGKMGMFPSLRVNILV
jgi:hypothetical protein